MATITPIKRKSGTRYRAQIRIRRKGEVVYSETETFTKKNLAIHWAESREAELRVPGALNKVRHKGVTLGQVMKWYFEDFDGLTKFGRTKLGHVQFLMKRTDFAEMDALSLTSGQLVDYAKSRKLKDGVKPATLNNDFVWLADAFRTVRITRDVPLNQQVVEDAAFVCRREGLIGKSVSRDRRPTLDELNKLLEYYSEKRRGIPMVDIILFAIFSTRRQDEICRILRADLDESRKGVLVRDIKHPREKIDTFCFLTDRAMNIIKRQPEEGKLIFPYNGKSISAAFTRGCSVLGIKDLRFHDLRHEGISHLFELEWEIPKVAGVSGHRSWQMLQRYTHLYELGCVDKYKGWKWLEWCN